MKLIKQHSETLYRILLFAVFVAISIFVFSNLEKLRANPVSFRWPYIALSLFLTSLAYLLSYTIWTRIAASFDMRSSWSHAGNAWFLSRLGRYIPGKLSLFLLRFNAYEGQSKTKVSAATFFEAYTSLCAATILLVIFVATNTHTIAPPAGILLFLVIVLIALSHPRITHAGLGTIGRCFSAPKLHTLPKQRETLLFVLAQLSALLLHGGGLFMAFNAVGHVDPSSYFLITTTYYVAGLAGALAVFAPGGVGVREAALFAMLVQYVDPVTLIVGVVLIRLVGITSEAILSLFFFICESKTSV